MTHNDDGIDLPLAWSPDGFTLAVRAVAGRTAADVGESHIDLVGPDGARSRASDSSDVQILGWLQ